MKLLLAFISAVLFSLGLGISGMTNPENVIGFLDIFGDWRPALAAVMVGGILVHTLSYKLIARRETPILHGRFHLPTRKDVDKKLIFGAFLFGTGWGLGGFCPGPALASLASLQSSVFYFVGAMLAGIALYHYVAKPIIMRVEK